MELLIYTDVQIFSLFLEKERSFLSQRDHIFENIQISQLAITVAFKLLIEDSDILKNYILKIEWFPSFFICTK